MSIFLDKVLTQIFSPIGVTLGVVFLALILLMLGRHRGATVLLVVVLAWGWVWSTPFLGSILYNSLIKRDRYLPHYVEDLPDGDAIVVLGGGVRPVSGSMIYPDLTARADRIWHASRCYYAGKAPLIVASGGNVWPGSERQSEADAMRIVLHAFGVPDDAIITESGSRNTRQNAIFTAKVVAGRGIKRILLVTSLSHMSRAEAAFRRVGFEVIPVAVDFFSPSRSPGIFTILPSAFALSANTRAATEHLGRLIYYIRG